MGYFILKITFNFPKNFLNKSIINFKLNYLNKKNNFIN